MSDVFSSITKDRLAGVVVLYQPDEELIENVETYQGNLGKLYIIDNSDKVDNALLEKLFTAVCSYEYISLKGNKGIAFALNVAAEKALNEGFHWLLTMDQDSKATPRMIERLAEVGKTLALDQIGILAPQYLPERQNKSEQSYTVEDADVVITSGNILNLQAYKQVGPFRNDLFIDYVDHEFCLRLRVNGYRVLLINDIPIIHKLGNSKYYNIMGRAIVTSNHNYIRRYYITRNRLVVLSQYKNRFPVYYKSEKRLNFSDFFKIILFEKDKFRKIRSLFLGYLDFYKSRFGKFDH